MVASVRALVKKVVFDRLPGVLRRGPTTQRRLALTFDDGPDSLTPRYLDVLDQLGVPATFFLLGEQIVAWPDRMREYLRRGHQVASHGFDHARFTQLGRRALLDQCARTEQLLGFQISGRPWVRPPHGALDPRSLIHLIAAGYTVAMWSFDSHDYDIRDADRLVEQCRPASLAAGDVLLFHEGQHWTVDALPRIVGAARDAGFDFVTMHDLFAA